MAALMTDVIQEKVPPRLVNAAVNAGRQMVKMAELNLKYGKAARKIHNAPSDLPCINLLTGQVE